MPENLRKNESIDFQYFYEPVALRLLSEQGLTTPDGQQALRYPPGYPLLLAGLFGSAGRLGIPTAIALDIFILCCAAGSALLLYCLASRVFGICAGLGAALLWSSYPIFLWLTKQPNSELPFLVFFYAAIFVLWGALAGPSASWPRMVGSGVLLGLSVLIRPAGLGAIGIFGLAILLTGKQPLRQRLIAAALLFASFSAVLLPWEAWVYHETGRIIPVSSGGGASIWDGLTFAAAGEEYQPRETLPPRLLQFMDDLNQAARQPDFDLSPAQINKAFWAQARLNSGAAFHLIGLKALRAWYGTESGRLETINILLQIGYLSLAALGAHKAWRAGGKQKAYVLLVGGLTLYFWLVSISVLSILRYTLPAMGLLITLIPAGMPFLSKLCPPSQPSPS